jgi:hypothetical protein
VIEYQKQENSIVSDPVTSTVGKALKTAIYNVLIQELEGTRDKYLETATQ